MIDRIIAQRCPTVHGILVQLPLPPSFRSHSVSCTAYRRQGRRWFPFSAMSAARRLAEQYSPAPLTACSSYSNTRASRSKVRTSSSSVASNIVGNTMALMLMQHEATVCICTPDAGFRAVYDPRRYLVVAAGHPNLIRPNGCAAGRCVIDVESIGSTTAGWSATFISQALRQKPPTSLPGNSRQGRFHDRVNVLVNTINSCKRWQQQASCLFQRVCTGAGSQMVPRNNRSRSTSDFVPESSQNFPPSRSPSRHNLAGSSAPRPPQKFRKNHDHFHKIFNGVASVLRIIITPVPRFG